MSAGVRKDESDLPTNVSTRMDLSGRVCSERGVKVDMDIMEGVMTRRDANLAEVSWTPKRGMYYMSCNEESRGNRRFSIPYPATFITSTERNKVNHTRTQGIRVPFMGGKSTMNSINA